MTSSTDDTDNADNADTADGRESSDDTGDDETTTDLVPHGADNPDRGREHIELLRETIDRNRTVDWENYRERYYFTVIDDGAVRISRQEPKREPQHAVESSVSHVVTVENGVAVACNCFMAGRRFTQERCRHMRAVDAHPYL